MKKYAVISYNNNPDYIYFAPLTMWAWERLGWNPVLIWVDGEGIMPFNAMISLHSKSDLHTIKVSEIEGYRSCTIAQISRLYAACKLDGYILTSDADMLPLSDYWQPNHRPTVWGYDLTGYSEYPISYIGMNDSQWLQVMGINRNEDITEQIADDLDCLDNAKSDDFYTYWGVDQQYITRRLKKFNPTIINRGQYPNGFARGRVDRGSWTLDHREFIDCHMHHQIYHKGKEWKFEQTMEMLRKVWPTENFDWFVEYHNEFKKLTGHA
jgi:hypothetical protein